MDKDINISDEIDVSSSRYVMRRLLSTLLLRETKFSRLLIQANLDGEMDDTKLRFKLSKLESILCQQKEAQNMYLDHQSILL